MTLLRKYIYILPRSPEIKQQILNTNPILFNLLKDFLHFDLPCSLFADLCIVLLSPFSYHFSELNQNLFKRFDIRCGSSLLDFSVLIQDMKFIAHYYPLNVSLVMEKLSNYVSLRKPIFGLFHTIA